VHNIWIKTFTSCKTAIRPTISNAHPRSHLVATHWSTRYIIQPTTIQSLFKLRISLPTVGLLRLSQQPITIRSALCYFHRKQ